MRAFFLVAGAALTLSACGGGESEANEQNAMMANDMMMDQNMAMDPAMNGMMTDPNMAMDANTQNMVMQDMNTNDPDANLANGM